jgi:hypothetical protein
VLLLPFPNSGCPVIDLTERFTEVEFPKPVENDDQLTWLVCAAIRALKSRIKTYKIFFIILFF